jgi:hypothetical protein
MVAAGRRRVMNGARKAEAYSPRNNCFHQGLSGSGVRELNLQPGALRPYGMGYVDKPIRLLLAIYTLFSVLPPPTPKPLPIVCILFPL